MRVCYLNDSALLNLMIKVRLTGEELKQINSLIKEGCSLKKIAKQTGKSKTTIYHHFMKIRGKTNIPVSIDIKNQDSLGYFIGFFAGDGYFFKSKGYNYRIFLFFGPNEINLKNQVKTMLTLLFNKEPCEAKEENMLILYYSSKEISLLIKDYLYWKDKTQKTYSVCLKKRSYSTDFKIGFLRGCIDSDGHISKNKLVFSSVSVELIKNIGTFLDDLHILNNYYINKDKRPNRKAVHNIFIRKRNHQLFLDIINPIKRVEPVCAGRDSKF
jgi:hypothetical protein